ncbi:MAG: NERD domain-containing protein/DEAD/DEAH box helicase, partial [Thermoleophilaceae bacterium]|nr:NERD domain-containing protein/DEAD/DEAH box helicase [Thermoleophilaceae bacterium]
MYPQRLSTRAEITKSERDLHKRLSDALDDDWTVIHASGLLISDSKDGARMREADFVIAHPERGILCLEVKGGGIEHQHGEWFRRNPGGTRERIEDPFEQVADERYALGRLLKKSARGKAAAGWLAHGVAFPYITIGQLALAPDAPRQILLDRHDVAEIEPAINRVLAFHLGSGPIELGEVGIQALRDTLVPEVRIEVPLAARFLEEEEELVLLTHEESMFLARASREHRMVVHGCAGSGKTMLAVEHAKRLAAAGEDVLFVCFNRALMQHLRKTVGGDGLTFQTFHGLCTHLAHRAEVTLPRYGSDSPPPEYWDEELPSALVEAIGELGPQFDALIVDEAQDLSNDWLAALMCTLRDEEHAPVWLFIDDNQRVYDKQFEVPAEFRPHELMVNCRNTQRIHREVMKLYEGEIVPEVRGPKGRDVELYLTDDQARKIGEVLETLCGKEEVLPQDVVVLSSHALDRS